MSFFSDFSHSPKRISIIGAAILDILAGPVNSAVFQTGSQPMEQIRMSLGGDALNEALALTKLGKTPELITKVGNDDSGQRILDALNARGISERGITIENGLETGINIVLVDESGERHFLTNPKSSLRKLKEEDILPYLDEAGEIVSFASLFVSPELDPAAMERIFRKIKEKSNRILVLDMTKPKNGETLDDLKGILPYIDYMLPNQTEIAILTGETDPVKNAALLVEAGVSHAVIKVGSQGCILASKCTAANTFAKGTLTTEASPDISLLKIPAYPEIHAIDTTGAGDCFAAGFLFALSEGWDAKECCRFACASASCTVEHYGATDGIQSLRQVMERYSFLVRH